MCMAKKQMGRNLGIAIMKLKKPLYFEVILDLEKSLQAEQRGHILYPPGKLPLILSLHLITV